MGGPVGVGSRTMAGTSQAVRVDAGRCKYNRKTLQKSMIYSTNHQKILKMHGRVTTFGARGSKFQILNARKMIKVSTPEKCP